MVDMRKDMDMSSEDLAMFGIDSIAYIRPTVVNGRKVHVVHAADGTLLTVITDRELAFITLRQHEMNPQSVH